MKIIDYEYLYSLQNWDALNNKKLQDEEVYEIGSDITKIRIEEREQEVTYLDYISFFYKESSSDALHEIAYPISELKNVDEIYLKLNQDESLEIDFRTLLPETAVDIKLKLNGYYEVLN